MTNVQWTKLVERLRKYREVRMPDGDLLILWDDGDVSLRDGEDGHAIICTPNINDIKFLYVEEEAIKFLEKLKKKKGA